MPDSDLAEAIGAVAEHLWSPNVMDSNMEAANVVDVLAALARATDRLAEAIELLARR